MKPFEAFLHTEDVRRTTPDFGLAQSLQKDATERVELILQLPLSDKAATLIFEQVYEALREYIDALLTLEGYKSYSHVASISFLQKYPEFTQTEINTLDNAREKRNLAKYYAEPIPLTETKELISFHNTIKPKLESQFKKLTKTSTETSPTE